MRELAAHRPATAPGEVGWEVRPARAEDAAAVAAAVAALVAELGGSPPPRGAIESEARAHIADPSLGIVLVAATRSDATAGMNSDDDAPEDELVGALTAS